MTTAGSAQAGMTRVIGWSRLRAVLTRHLEIVGVLGGVLVTNALLSVGTIPTWQWVDRFGDLGFFGPEFFVILVLMFGSINVLFLALLGLFTLRHTPLYLWVIPLGLHLFIPLLLLGVRQANLDPAFEYWAHRDARHALVQSIQATPRWAFPPHPLDEMVHLSPDVPWSVSNIGEWHAFEVFDADGVVSALFFPPSDAFRDQPLVLYRADDQPPVLKPLRGLSNRCPIASAQLMEDHWWLVYLADRSAQSACPT